MTEKRDEKAEFIALMRKSVLENIPKENFGVLLSGGIDSTFIALMLKNLGAEFKAYTAVVDYSLFSKPEDLIFAEKAAKDLGIELVVVKVGLEEIEKNIKEIVKAINSANPIDVGVALPLFFACRKAKSDGIKFLFHGTGSDELLAGYKRFENTLDVNKECMASFEKLLRNDLLRDRKIAEMNGIELKTPYLDKDVIDFALKLPAELKISSRGNKLILRGAAEELGLKKSLAERKKKAMQYGSNFDKAIEKLAKKNKMKKSEYLESLLKN